MLKSAVSYLLQSGLHVQAGNGKDDTLVIRVHGAKSANFGTGLDFVPSDVSSAMEATVPSEKQVQISDGTPPVPSNVPSATESNVPSEKVANFSHGDNP